VRDLTRRNAIKLVATGTALAVGVTTARAQDKDKDKDKQKAETKKAAEAYLYPQAEAVNTTTRSMETVYTTKLTSKDDAKKVYQWYRKKLDVDDLISEGLLSSDKQIDAIAEYTTEARAFQPARPLELYVLVSRRVNAYTITVVVSRGKDEKETHIALTLLAEPKK
jgi:hypothetical protein